MRTTATTVLLAGVVSASSPASEPPFLPGGTRSVPSPSHGATDFAAGRVGFSVAFRDVVTPYRVFLLTALPAEEVRLRVLPDRQRGLTRANRPALSLAGLDAARFEATTSAGVLSRVNDTAWNWRAPDEPGHYRVELTDRVTGEKMTLSAAVLVPRDESKNGTVRGYRVGDFPRTPYRGLPQYRRPAGFIVLNRDHADVPVSPHFTLGQFPAKGPPGWPKYLLLSERLLLKLELLLEEANRRGLRVPTFQVLSGFRSPWYNRGIGRPKYSRHIYGDAADVYVDTDGDGLMDDLNRDGRIDIRDAGLLYDIVEEMDGTKELQHLVGGLGKYRTTSSHGPFIHVDTRLYRARW